MAREDSPLRKFGILAFAAASACSSYAQESASFVQGKGVNRPGATPPVLLSKDELDQCPSTLVRTTLVSGITEVHAAVDAQGKPTDVKITQSSGSKEHDDAAVTCLKGSRFTPGVVDGQPSEGQVDMTVKWKSPGHSEKCDPTMGVAATVEVAVTPSSTESEPLPAGAQATVCGCVNGADKSEPVILHSSGNARLDEGAILLMRRGMEEPTSRLDCYALRIEFHHRN